jgi:hypothetical protein
MDFDGRTLGAHADILICAPMWGYVIRCGLNREDNAAEPTVKAFGSLHISKLHHEAAGHEQHNKYIKNTPLHLEHASTFAPIGDRTDLVS